VAIEQGVYEMIMAGEKKGLWRYKKPAAAARPEDLRVEEKQNELVQKNTTQNPTPAVTPTKVAPTDVPVSKTQTRRATVVEWSNVRINRDHQSEKVVNLRPGAEIEILAEDKNFYNVRADGKEGWVAKRFIKAHQ
jgi:SH3-like domain-containing protein